MDFVNIDSNLNLRRLTWMKTEDGNPGKGKKPKNTPEPMLPEELLELQDVEPVEDSKYESFNSYEEMVDNWKRLDAIRYNSAPKG